jgi:hypothetical protein
MQRYAASCLVLMVLAVGCEESGPPAHPSAEPLSVKEAPLTATEADSDGPARDVYGRPLVGTDGPLRYPSPASGESEPTSGGADSPEPSSNHYTLGAYTSRAVGSWEEAVAIGDVTCDGRPDVVLTTTSYSDPANDYRVFVFPQLANGTLGTAVSYPYGARGSRNGLVLTDLNRDSCLDVVVGHGTGISVLLANRATGSLSSAVVTVNADADTVSSMDVNRDGNLDIISLGWSRGATLFYGNGAGAFPQIAALATNASGYNDHEVGDLNSDGIPDLAVMSGQTYAVPNLSVHLHNGTNGLSTTPRTYFMGQNELAGGIGIGDVNGDGRRDVVLSRPRNSPTVLWLMLQDASGNLVGPTTISSYDIPDSLQVADVDGDGDDDIVVAHSGWLKVGVYLQEAGVLRPEALYSLPYASSYAPQGLAVGDFSGDGCADVALADYNNGLVTLYGNCPNPCANAANGTACDDHNACTRTDTCQAGACVGANPVTCTAQDQCHAAGVCDPASGVCSNPSKADGTTCNDGNACTRTDTCRAGACIGANPVTCTAQDQCHTAGVCNPASGVCSNPNKADGTTCNDGSACTRTDTCQAGSCVGANPVTCTAQDQCHEVGACDPASGVCSNPSKADGSACTDGNACTQTDTCQAGACTGANPVTCTAQDQCHTAGVCNPASGVCSNPSKADGSACTDSNACTQEDTCQAGSCVGAKPVTCTAQDQCHTAGVCDPASGVCSNPTVPDGAVCSGGTCNAGVCVSPPDGGSDGGPIDDGPGDVNPGDGRCGCGASDTPYLNPAWMSLVLLFVFRRRVLGSSNRG